MTTIDEYILKAYPELDAAQLQNLRADVSARASKLVVTKQETGASGEDLENFVKNLQLGENERVPVELLLFLSERNGSTVGPVGTILYSTKEANKSKTRSDLLRFAESENGHLPYFIVLDKKYQSWGGVVAQQADGSVSGTVAADFVKFLEGISSGQPLQNSDSDYPVIAAADNQEVQTQQQPAQQQEQQQVQEPAVVPAQQPEQQVQQPTEQVQQPAAADAAAAAVAQPDQQQAQVAAPVDPNAAPVAAQQQQQQPAGDAAAAAAPVDPNAAPAAAPAKKPPVKKAKKPEIEYAEDDFSSEDDGYVDNESDEDFEGEDSGDDYSEASSGDDAPKKRRAPARRAAPPARPKRAAATPNKRTRR